MTNFDPHIKQQLLDTVDREIWSRPFDSFSPDEIEQRVWRNRHVPEQREPIISIDPYTEVPPAGTIADAVELIVPRVVEYSERNKDSISDLIELGHVVGLRQIAMFGYFGPGFSFWKPSKYLLEPPVQVIPNFPPLRKH